MGKNNRRSVGSFSLTRRFKNGFHTKTTFYGSERNSCHCPKFKYFTIGGRQIITKRCNRECPSRKQTNRFLLNIFSGPKEDRGLKTNYKFKTSEQVSKEGALQNGLFKQSHELSTARRLGNFSRFVRRLPSHSSPQKIQTIPKVLHSGESLPIHLPLFWSHNGAKGLHQNSVRDCSISKDAECAIGSLSRRLVSGQSVKEITFTGQRKSAQSSCQTRFHDKSRKISSNSMSESNIHRGSFPVRQGTCLPYSRENSENQPSNISDNAQSNSSKFFTSFGSNGLMHRGDTECSVVHETNSTPFTAVLETNYQRSPSQNTSEQTLTEPLEMVAEPRQFTDREVILSNTQHKSCDNRCIKKGLWGSFRKPNLSRVLVRNRKKITHKSSRVESSAFDHSEIFTPVKRSQCPSAIRQHDSGSIYKQTRGDKVSSVMFSDMGSDANDNQEQNNSESSSYNWESEHFGRQSEQSQNTTYRMDSEQFGVTEHISDLGYSNDRSVCLGGESQSDNVLFMDAQSSSVCCRRPISVLGEHGGICISSNSIDSQGATTHEEVSLSVDSDCPTVAQETLVYRPSSDVSSMSETTPSNTRPSVSTTNKNSTPKSSSFQACGMVALNRSFQNKGFSTDTRKLMEASWRPGTRRDYAAKFNKFSGWCSEREINPYTATVTQCAEFLSFLFHSGLKYRTIAGYRSMLSVVLSPADGMPVGQHPDILRLLKGVFNSRPPEKRLMPEWDLKKVLDFLLGSLFEPISKVSLKYLTLKSVFLAAISTFRRCSDLQALRIDEGFMSIVPEGIIFIRDGLSKQDRPGHIGTKIFIPAFSRNVKLDPKRAIQMYLKKTEQFRNDENRLFLSFNKPHKAVTSQTISSWIVSVLKQAYNDSDLKVKAHSTRTIGSSWALFKGASLSSILEAADWSRDSTFKKFYYRQLNSQEWELE